MASMRIPHDRILDVLRRVLIGKGFDATRAQLCARLFVETDRDGVYSHGLNRFPRFIRTIENGVVDVHAEPVGVAAHHGLERWDGCRGPGNLNAYASMARAIGLAREHGIGCIGLANTNHWMRGGSYGWQAADAGVIGICWTNTLANVPPWGAREPRIGNNPLVIAVPRADGHVVLDMAMSQFSLGALQTYRAKQQSLPVAGGYDAEGRLSTDAAAIEASRRLLPIGFWKGSGLAIMLDMVAAVLAGGLATHQIPHDPERESSLSQVFIAIDASLLGADGRIADAIVGHLHATPAADGQVRYPGERTLETRRRNMVEGIPVDESVWQWVCGL
jgi:3-dehydro-L-gulonate 2-dehydrogenase